jgi:DNA-binding XRE family transcriptional regulator
MVELDDLTRGAKLELLRKRDKLTRKELADNLQVCSGTIYNLEKGITKRGGNLPHPDVGSLTKEEQFKLQRKLTGMTQAQVAKEIGVCRYSVILMEQGKIDSERLVKFWEL